MRRALLIVLLAFGCASAGAVRAPSYEEDRITIYVENNIMQDVTLYLMDGDRRVSRIGDCSGLHRCVMSISKGATADIASKGILEIGWRWKAKGRVPGSWVDARLTITYVTQMDAVLTLNRLNTWLQPIVLLGDRQI